MEFRPASCNRAAEFVSLELDGELSPFERAMLERHIQRCELCAEYARTVVGLTELLRATPVEEFRLPIVQLRSRRRVGRVVRSVAATAAVAAVGVWLGVSSSGSPRAPGRVQTFSSDRALAVVSDHRNDWSAGLPRTRELVQLSPGGLYSGDMSP
jgi:anti-sigma factor RsiW